MAHSAIENLDLHVLRTGGPSLNGVWRKPGSGGLCRESLGGEGLWIPGYCCSLLRCFAHEFSFWAVDYWRLMRVPQYSVNPAQRILSMVLLRGVVAGCDCRASHLI